MNRSNSESTRSRRWTLARRALVPLAVAFVAIQFVPYGRDHENPPVTGSPHWDSARTEALARRACFDCHSNETTWPWYSSVAPLSWRIQGHVDEGREHLNFSTFDRTRGDAHEAAEVVAEGEMPLTDYVLAHPSARLDDAETRALIDGLTRTFGNAEDDRHADDDDR